MLPQYRIYIDESGDHTYNHCDEDSKRYLGLVGCVIENDHYRTKFQPDFEAFKQKHFPHNPDDPVIFVRSKIVSKYGAFWRLKDKNKRDAFNEELLQFIEGHNFMVIAVVIDKKTHLDSYGIAAYHPYHFCVAAMMERYCGWLDRLGRMGDAMAESRAGEDKFLKEAFRHLYCNGTYFHRPPFFQKGLTSAEIKLKCKDANIAGLQLADLLAHPCKEEILIQKGLITDIRGDFTKKFREVIEKKYNHHFYSGRIDGYGKVFLPRKN
ncbi:MAG TPA: DUF3800 domain-containing protein [Anaerolineales bacterium]|nr:DUF3800 domain-containing protein [Anaerolineales bacterium]